MTEKLKLCLMTFSQKKSASIYFLNILAVVTNCDLQTNKTWKDKVQQTKLELGLGLGLGLGQPLLLVTTGIIIYCCLKKRAVAKEK